uniref:Uncharacterized protein n=1 Tax=Chromera velia CCMP2878 TaxID=1169474 RepID=A0A0G4HH32_9ALVE|eukprot:Cvel_6773.t1-p1 / transcript=Cvel_6773.t1 / gene=Cvel_6773 / organism=Chromera_velia_CCMP2878 / gene_product=hypothetical protein / transcript_product=hypothetical protein / location=Cvel_scaffold340:14371-16878(-) / protein_length=515 / sequence_SO=supercontig / SO=protein_coding / is_pseudo=false
MKGDGLLDLTSSFQGLFTWNNLDNLGCFQALGNAGGDDGRVCSYGLGTLVQNCARLFSEHHNGVPADLHRSPLSGIVLTGAFLSMRPLRVSHRIGRCGCLSLHSFSRGAASVARRKSERSGGVGSHFSQILGEASALLRHSHTPLLRDLLEFNLKTGLVRCAVHPRTNATILLVGTSHTDSSVRDFVLLLSKDRQLQRRTVWGIETCPRQILSMMGHREASMKDLGKWPPVIQTSGPEWNAQRHYFETKLPELFKEAIKKGETKGSDMLSGLAAAMSTGAPIALLDVDLKSTFSKARRCYLSVDRLFNSSSKLLENASSFLLKERDFVMAHKLLSVGDRFKPWLIVGIVGRFHLPGVQSCLVAIKKDLSVEDQTKARLLASHSPTYPKSPLPKGWFTLDSWKHSLGQKSLRRLTQVLRPPEGLLFPDFIKILEDPQRVQRMSISDPEALKRGLMSVSINLARSLATSPKEPRKAVQALDTFVNSPIGEEDTRQLIESLQASESLLPNIRLTADKR